MKREFPELHSQFQQAVARDEKAEKGVQVGEPDAFSDGVDIFYGYYDAEKERVVCKGVTSLKHDAHHICQRIHVYDRYNRLIIASGTVDYHCHHATFILDEVVQLTDAQKSGEIIFEYFSLWYNGTDGLNAAYYCSQDQTFWSAVDYVEDVRMIDPVHKKTDPDKEIIVCYNRSSQSGETVDYDAYEEAFDPETRRQKLYLDVGAEVILSQEALPFSAVDMTKLLLKLDCQSGLAYYKKEGRVQEIMDSFKATDRGFEFRLDKDWQGVVPAARLPMQEPVDFLMRAEFLCGNYQKRGRFIIDSSSETEPGDAFVKTISKIKLLWGCVADDMPILMADGSTRRAGDVRIGDMLQMEKGMGRVQDAIRGREDAPLCCIETENGRRLCCTGDHPVLARRGYVQAKELNGEDEVRDFFDGFVRIARIYPHEHRSVINYMISAMGNADDIGSFVCGGIVVGDDMMQMKLQSERARARRERVISPEQKKLKDYFGEVYR